MLQANENVAVAKIAQIVALSCGAHPSVARQIRAAAALHDVGKSKLPEGILDKQGRLEDWEFEILKTHTTLGVELLASFQGDLGEMAKNICLYHHEQYNGKGYWGRYTCELPGYVAIVAISDVFVALVSERPYKRTWSYEDAALYIESQAGQRFHPSLARIFVSLIRAGRFREVV